MIKYIKYIGFAHLAHSPILILTGLTIVNEPVYNILYLQYFFGIMFLYTFFNGECPITYYCKSLTEPTYIAGTTVTEYPEMYLCIPNKKIVDTYISIMTVLYIVVLIHTVTCIPKAPYEFLCIVFFVLGIYFLFIRRTLPYKYFYMFQIITRSTLSLALVLLNSHIYYIT